MGKKSTETKKQEEKKEQPQNPTIKVPPEVKSELEGMKQPGEDIAAVIRRLMRVKAIQEAPEKGMVTLKMPETNYRQLLVMQPSSVLSDMLRKAKV